MKYMIGDIVRTLIEGHEGNSVFPIGILGVIEEIHTSTICQYKVSFGDRHFWYYEDTIELLKTYDDGINDAWELARSIVLPCTTGMELNASSLKKIFGTTDYEAVLRGFDAREALDLVSKALREGLYDAKIGDEVIHVHVNERGAVTAIEDLSYKVLLGDGSTTYWSKSECKSTGKHFEIERILKGLGGE